MRKGGTTVTIHERYRLYYVDLIRPETNPIATIYTTTHGDQGTPRSYGSEDNESHEDSDQWIDERDSSGDDGS